MKRKVIQLAGKTLVVSLPSRWARDYDVKKGLEVEVEERKASLLIRSPAASDSTGKSVTIDVSGMGVMIKRILGALFKLGYDEVHIKFGTLKDLEDIQEVIKDEFIGFEVIDRRKNSIELKNIANINYGEFNSMLRRTFLIIKQMASESLEAIGKNDIKWAGAIAFMDKDVNRYCDFCRRILNTKGYAVTQRAAPMYCIVEQLERVGDSYRDICKLYVNKRFKLSTTLKELYTEVNKYLDVLYELYYSFNFEKIGEFGDISKRLSEKCENVLKNSKREEVIVASKLNSARENLFDMNGVIFASKL